MPSNKERSEAAEKKHVGQKYGALTYINKDPNDNAKALFKCDCGNTKIARRSDVLSGKTTSCGCQRVSRLRNNKKGYKEFVSLVGKRFSRLVVTEDLKDHRAMVMCDCGQVKDVSKTYLKNGEIKSCGCLKAELSANARRGESLAKSGELIISYDDYLTEAKMVLVLDQIVGSANVKTQYKLEGQGHRYDACLTLGSKKFLVEYDGHHHYIDPKNILNDLEFDKAAVASGSDIIRIPYWIQLNAEAIESILSPVLLELKLRGIELSIRSHVNFKQGFITTRHLPASFCQLGVIRFDREMGSLAKEIRAEIMASLDIKAKKLGNWAVYPSSWLNEKGELLDKYSLWR